MSKRRVLKSAAMTTSPKPVREGRSAAGSLPALSWAHFLNDGSANFLPGILPALLVSMGLPVSLAGTLMGALLIGQGFQPLTGYLADRIGGRRQMAIALIATSLGGMLVGIAPGYWPMVAVLAWIGLANAFFHPPGLASARQLGGSKPGRAMAYFLVGGEVGRGAWPLLASAVVTAFGMPWIWLLGLPGVITSFVLHRFAPHLEPRPRHHLRIRWRSHLRPMARVVAVSALRTLMILASVTFLPILWQQRGASLVAGAATITVIQLVGIVGNLGGGQVSDRIGRRPVLLASMGSAALLLAAIVLAPDGWWIWPLLALFGIAVFATLPLTVLLAQDVLPENPSMGSGLALGFANSLAAVAVMALGPVAERWGVHAALWVAVAGGVIAWWLARGLDRKPA